MLLWLLVALCLDRALLQISGSNYTSPFNGLGAVDLVNARRAKAPMAYRVLFPWFVGLLEWLYPSIVYYRASVYEAFKIITLTLALAACERAVGRTGTLLIAACLPMTFAFDYWCWTIELLAFALALSGSFQLTLLAALALALSRETAPLVPPTYLLVTGDWNGALVIGIATALALLGVRLFVGKRELYCDRIMLRRNARELREYLTSHHPLGMDYTSFALLISGAALAVVVSGTAGAAWVIPLILLALGWVCGIARETRIFTPVLLWIALGLVR